jgi:prepilin-type processing-associated H-X9-DG protein
MEETLPPLQARSSGRTNSLRLRTQLSAQRNWLTLVTRELVAGNIPLLLSSRHAGGTNFAFTDGHVEFISRRDWN